MKLILKIILGDEDKVAKRYDKAYDLDKIKKDQGLKDVLWGDWKDELIDDMTKQVEKFVPRILQEDPEETFETQWEKIN